MKKEKNIEKYWFVIKSDIG